MKPKLNTQISLLFQIQSRVASLSLLTCDGHPLTIENLTATDEITMDIPYVNNPNTDPSNADVTHDTGESWEYVLLKENMNVHSFNITAERRLQSFHIELRLEELTEERAFDMSLLLR